MTEQYKQSKEEIKKEPNMKMVEIEKEIDQVNMHFLDVPLVLGDPYEGELNCNMEEDKWVKENLGENGAIELKEEVGKLKKLDLGGKTLAINLLYAKKNPGQWIESSYWVHFREPIGNGEHEETVYDYDNLVDLGFEIAENTQGYLCIRWPKKK